MSLLGGAGFFAQADVTARFRAAFRIGPRPHPFSTKDTLMRSTLRFALPALAVLGLGTALFAEAHADPVEARQEHMKAMGAQLGILGKMAQGETPYDAAAASEAAAELSALAVGLTEAEGWWPEGTDNTSGADTKALPAIWENMDDFESKMDDLVTAAAAMEAVAGDGLEAVQGEMRTIGGACGACHSDYRERS